LYASRMKKIISIIAGAVLVDQIVKGILLSLAAGGWHLFGDYRALVPNPVLFPDPTGAIYPNPAGWFNMTFTWNPGTAFSLFQELPSVITIAATGLIIGFLGHYLFTKVRHNRELWAMSLIVGGALGNLIDRIRFGAVIDFLNFGLPYKDCFDAVMPLIKSEIFICRWPAFNIADACISIGVALYILHYALIFISKRKHNGKV